MSSRRNSGSEGDHQDREKTGKKDDEFVMVDESSLHGFSGAHAAAENQTTGSSLWASVKSIGSSALTFIHAKRIGESAMPREPEVPTSVNPPKSAQIAQEVVTCDQETVSGVPSAEQGDFPSQSPEPRSRRLPEGHPEVAVASARCQAAFSHRSESRRGSGEAQLSTPLHPCLRPLIPEPHTYDPSSDRKGVKVKEFLSGISSRAVHGNQPTSRTSDNLSATADEDSEGDNDERRRLVPEDKLPTQVGPASGVEDSSSPVTFIWCKSISSEDTASTSSIGRGVARELQNDGVPNEETKDSADEPDKSASSLGNASVCRQQLQNQDEELDMSPETQVAPQSPCTSQSSSASDRTDSFSVVGAPQDSGDASDGTDSFSVVDAPQDSGDVSDRTDSFSVVDASQDSASDWTDSSDNTDTTDLSDLSDSECESPCTSQATSTSDGSDSFSVVYTSQESGDASDGPDSFSVVDAPQDSASDWTDSSDNTDTTDLSDLSDSECESPCTNQATSTSDRSDSFSVVYTSQDSGDPLESLDWPDWSDNDDIRDLYTSEDFSDALDCPDSSDNDNTPELHTSQDSSDPLDWPNSSDNDNKLNLHTSKDSSDPLDWADSSDNDDAPELPDSECESGHSEPDTTTENVPVACDVAEGNALQIIAKEKGAVSTPVELDTTEGKILVACQNPGCNAIPTTTNSKLGATLESTANRTDAFFIKLSGQGGRVRKAIVEALYAGERVECETNQVLSEKGSTIEELTHTRGQSKATAQESVVRKVETSASEASCSIRQTQGRENSSLRLGREGNVDNTCRPSPRYPVSDSAHSNATVIPGISSRKSQSSKDGEHMSGPRQGCAKVSHSLNDQDKVRWRTLPPVPYPIIVHNCRPPWDSSDHVIYKPPFGQTTSPQLAKTTVQAATGDAAKPSNLAERTIITSAISPNTAAVGDVCAQRHDSSLIGGLSDTMHADQLSSRKRSAALGFPAKEDTPQPLAMPAIRSPPPPNAGKESWPKEPGVSNSGCCWPIKHLLRRRSGRTSPTIPEW